MRQSRKHPETPGWPGRDARPVQMEHDADAEHARYLERHLQPGPLPAALPEAA